MLCRSPYGGAMMVHLLATEAEKECFVPTALMKRQSEYLLAILEWFGTYERSLLPSGESVMESKISIGGYGFVRRKN
ncbi:MAG: hypothetical protein WC673_02415 [Candidatus Paceibacterota bacterium]